MNQGFVSNSQQRKYTILHDNTAPFTDPSEVMFHPCSENPQLKLKDTTVTAGRWPSAIRFLKLDFFTFAPCTLRPAASLAEWMI